MCRSLNKNTTLTESGPSYIYLGNYAIQHTMQLYIITTFIFMYVYRFICDTYTLLCLFLYINIKFDLMMLGRGQRVAGREGEREKMGGRQIQGSQFYILQCISYMYCLVKEQLFALAFLGDLALEFYYLNSQGRRSLVGCRLWGRTESDTTEVTQQQQQQAWVSSD